MSSNRSQEKPKSIKFASVTYLAQFLAAVRKTTDICVFFILYFSTHLHTSACRALGYPKSSFRLDLSSSSFRKHCTQARRNGSPLSTASGNGQGSLREVGTVCLASTVHHSSCQFGIGSVLKRRDFSGNFGTKSWPESRDAAFETPRDRLQHFECENICRICLCLGGYKTCVRFRGTESTSDPRGSSDASLSEAFHPRPM